MGAWLAHKENHELLRPEDGEAQSSIQESGATRKREEEVPGRNAGPRENSGYWGSVVSEWGPRYTI